MSKTSLSHPRGRYGNVGQWNGEHFWVVAGKPSPGVLQSEAYCSNWDFPYRKSILDTELPSAAEMPESTQNFQETKIRIEKAGDLFMGSEREQGGFQPFRLIDEGSGSVIKHRSWDVVEFVSMKFCGEDIADDAQIA